MTISKIGDMRSVGGKKMLKAYSHTTKRLFTETRVDRQFLNSLLLFVDGRFWAREPISGEDPKSLNPSDVINYVGSIRKITETVKNP